MLILLVSFCQIQAFCSWQDFYINASLKEELFHKCLFYTVYSPDMPSRLPIQDIFAGLVTSIGTAIRYWFHYTLVAFAWLGVVPLTACEY